METTVEKVPIIPVEYTSDEVTVEALIRFLEFTPSLETALRYLLPEVALLLFEREDPDSITRWLETAHLLLEPYAGSDPPAGEII